MSDYFIVEQSQKIKFLFRPSNARKEELKRKYDWLMLRAIGRIKITGVHENHHILPSSLGGTDVPENIATLTYREHYLAHWLLCRITDGADRQKMLHALTQMSLASQFTESRLPSSWQYALSRRAHVEAIVTYFSDMTPEELLEHGRKTAEGMGRWKKDIGDESFFAWCRSIAEGLDRWRERIGEDGYAEWLNTHGERTSEGMAAWKAEMGVEAYTKRCAEQGIRAREGWAHRKNRIGQEAHVEWCKDVGVQVSVGYAKWKAEDPEGYAAHFKEKNRKALESRLNKRPQVLCLNDGVIHQNADVAAEFYKLKNYNIRSVCRGNYKQTGGYRFEYIPKEK